MKLTRTSSGMLLAMAAVAGFSAGELMAAGTAPAAPGAKATPQTVPEPPQQMAQATAPKTAAPAPGPCTGVPEAKCAATAGCVWLPGYKVKGGADVVGYCRPAPKPLTSRKPADGTTPKQ